MKITAITCCGSYAQPWITHGIAALYNSVDEIIVVNAGIDIMNPSAEKLVPIPGMKDILGEIDIDKKIVLVENINWKSAGKYISQEREDVRGLNLSIATQLATKQGADWIFKYDTDQVMYPMKRKTLERLARNHEFTGFIFYEHKDFWVDVRYQRDGPPPRSEYEDGPKFYKSLDLDIPQTFVGQGAPNIWTHQEHSTEVVSSHLRECFPIGWSVEKMKDAYFQRLWYRYYQSNHLGVFKFGKKDKMSLDEIQKECQSRTDGWYTTKRKVCLDPPRAALINPVEYIEKDTSD